jgi:hypothetical protein
MTDVKKETFPENNQEEQEEKDNEYKEEVLRLVFEESKCLRDEFAGRLIHNTDKIWSLQNALMVLLGAYIAFFTFIFGDGKDVVNKTSITFPMVLCFIFLAIALFLTLKGIIPKYTLFAPNPNKVYAFIAEDKKKALEKFIGTYLHHYKDTLIKIEEVNTLRKKIIHIEAYSIIEFALSALISTVDTKYTQLITIVSLLLLTLFTADYMNVISSEKERTRLFIEELNSDK